MLYTKLLFSQGPKMHLNNSTCVNVSTTLLLFTIFWLYVNEFGLYPPARKPIHGNKTTVKYSWLPQKIK